MTAEEDGGRYASPPCMAGEIAPDYFDPLAVDPAQARDVARWRRAERERLRAERLAMSVEARATVGRASATLRGRRWDLEGGWMTNERGTKRSARHWRQSPPEKSV